MSASPTYAPGTPPAPPRHVAIIMDGNGRWATKRGLPRTVGHRKGIDAARRVTEAAPDCGVEYLTLFGFSSENWTRPRDEVTELMHLLRFYLRSETAELHRNNVRIRMVGDRSRLAPDILKLIDQAEALTRGNARLHLTIALSYGGRADILQATRALAEAAWAGQIDPAHLDEAMFARHLLTADLPDPDLLVRTSGEKRISNFLLWQCAYAELVFLDTLWPDFTRADLEHAIGEYHRRDRRFGAVAGR